jgi:hypothetical protein
MTLNEIAKGLGLSRVRVSQMKAQGMPTHDVEAARAWRQANIWIPVPPPRVQLELESASEGVGEIPIPSEALPPSGYIYDIGSARAKRETHEANLAEMREAKEAGNLVERERVSKAATDAAALLRQGLERIPGLSQELAAMTGPEPIRERLTVVIEQVLIDLVDNLRRLANPGAPDGRG